MKEKTLKFTNIKINKKGFHKSKQEIDLDSVTTDKIVVSAKFMHSEEGYKYFIGYQEDEIIRPLCIILPQMNGYIIWGKYEDIWDVIKNKLGIKFNSEPIYEKKIREFDGDIKINFLGNGLPKENMYYTNTNCITIDSVIKMNKKNYPQVYFEECKYKIKKTQTPRFINTELETYSEPDLETDSELDTTTEH